MGTIRSAATLLRKSGGTAAGLLLLLATCANGAPALVKVVALRSQTSTTNSSITANVPSSGLAAGNSVILTLQAGDAAGAISCSDTVNGAYDSEVVSTAGVTRIAIISKHNLAATGFGTAITCTYPQFSGSSSLGVYEFSGLETAATFDQGSEGGGSDAGAATSGLTAATSQPNEMVFGFVRLSAGQTLAVATSGGNPLENPYVPPYTSLTGPATQRPLYRFVNAVRQYEANGTITGAGAWQAAVATYRLAPDPCYGVDCSDGNDCTVDSCNPSTGACGYAPEAVGIRCGNPTSGICDSADRCDGAGACLANNIADGTECGQPDGDCEFADTCQQGVCQQGGFRPLGSACGEPATGACDGADSCDASGFCLANLAPDGASCGDPGSECTNADSCLSGACQDNGFAPPGSVCGDRSSSACDAADGCDGSGVCLDNLATSGSTCSDGEECTINDACNASGQCVGAENPVCFECGENVAPEVTAVVADPAVPIPLEDGGIVLTALFTDSAEQTHTCIVDWADGSLADHFAAIEPAGADPGRCVGNHVYTAPGVYEVTVMVADSCGETASAVYRYAVVYDPSGGFVTGGGWIDSPEGAYRHDPAASGRAQFGVSAKYDKGGSQPKGDTQFHFQAGGFQFVSTSYEWLVISGSKARLRGAGAANGAAGHEFELTATDGEGPGGGGVDRFRIKVWQGNPGNVIYDNLLGMPDSADPTPIGGGSITIHKK